MDEERRARIMAEAKRNVAKFHAGNLERDEVEPPRQVSLPPLEVEDRAARWRNFHAERDAGRQRARAELRRSEQKMVNNATTAAGPSEAELVKILGQCFAEERKRLGEALRAEHVAELADLKNQIAELRGQVGTLLSLLSATKGGDVVALPRRA
jgi:hypothetical protein